MTTGLAIIILTLGRPFYVVVNYYLVSLSFKFFKDICINAHAGVVNVSAHVLSRVRAFTTRARAFEFGSS